MRAERPTCSRTAEKIDEVASPQRSPQSLEKCIVAAKAGVLEEDMSALGQKQTFAAQKAMSALPPKADMCGAIAHVCFVPKADIGRNGDR